MSKNRLRNTRCYLAGAVDRCPDLGMTWRENIAKELRKDFGVIVYNPLDNGENSHREDLRRWKEEGDWENYIPAVQAIRDKDLQMVHRSDWLILRLDMDVHTCGSYEELNLAIYQNKHTFIVCKQGIKQIPGWIFAKVPVRWMFNTFHEMFVRLRWIDSCSDNIDGWPDLPVNTDDVG